MKCAGGDGSALRMCPPNERFDADHPLTREFDDRLIDQKELGRTVSERFDCSPQVLFEFELIDEFGMHLGREDLVTALSTALGPVHREIRVTEDFAGAFTGTRGGHSDAGADPNLSSVQKERNLECSRDSLDNDDRILQAWNVVEKHREFVTAEACDGIAAPGGVQEPGSDRAEKPITRGMTETVIDGLEVVQIEEDDRETRTMSALSCEGVFDTVAKKGAVRESREAHREMPDERASPRAGPDR